MIDPRKITDYGRSQRQLEEFAIFAILVAGKKALLIAQRLEELLFILREKHCYPEMGVYCDYTPLQLINLTIQEELANLMRICGIGCFNNKSKFLKALAEKVCNKKVNLSYSTVEELEKIPGIGRKTSRFFLLHSRSNCGNAVLDTHILKFLKESGVADVPKSTPTSDHQYNRLEEHFIRRVPFGMSIAEFDLQIWNSYSKGGKKDV